ncbi:MAG: thiamine biosynthesis lipoprotein ApbE [Ilumatobacteraceae bacterium]|nr:thiamine biosynthesis lipoprotein ApbE [Ilumatobacteraceae bacterium]
MSVSTIATRPVAEAHFRAMGTRAHIIVTDGDNALLHRAIARVEELESRWSRFRDNSEISRLNRNAGEFCHVSADTSLMVERAIELWRMTGASVDPLVLGAVIDAGYDRSFETLSELRSRASSRRAPEPWTMIACTDIDLHLEQDGASPTSAGARHRIRLPRGAQFDPGGIGKGLAADMIVAELLMAGASGACVNLGGDLRVDGRAPQDGGWTVAIDHPTGEDPIAVVHVGDGAVATSSTLRRTWMVGEERRHHLIDPSTGRPSTTDLVQATVIAGQAWVAEGLAKAVLLRGSHHPFDLLPDGIEAMAVHRDGRILASAGLQRFVADGLLPTQISLDIPHANTIAEMTEATS